MRSECNETVTGGQPPHIVPNLIPEGFFFFFLLLAASYRVLCR